MPNHQAIRTNYVPSNHESVRRLGIPARRSPWWIHSEGFVIRATFLLMILRPSGRNAQPTGVLSTATSGLGCLSILICGTSPALRYSFTAWATDQPPTLLGRMQPDVLSSGSQGIVHDGSPPRWSSRFIVSALEFTIHRPRAAFTMSHNPCRKSPKKGTAKAASSCRTPKEANQPSGVKKGGFVPSG